LAELVTCQNNWQISFPPSPRFIPSSFNHRLSVLDDGDGWETVTSKNRPKHAKLTKTTSDTKIANTSFEKDATPPKSVQRNVNSSPQSPTQHGSSSYVNKVVDRIIDLERSPPSKNTNTSPPKTIVVSKMQKSQSFENVDQTKKVKFCTDIEGRCY